MPTAPTSTRNRSNSRRSSIHTAVRMMDPAVETPVESLDRRRRMLAGVFRMLGEQLKHNRAPGRETGRAARADVDGVSLGSLSPRMRQTLDRLLAGDSEKEIAARLGLSPHTVHVYIKSLYPRLGVSSRGELFAVITGRRTVAPLP